MGTLNYIIQGTTLIVYFKGEVTLHTSSGLRAEIEDLLVHEDVENLVIDLSDVEFIDSSGIGMLVALKTKTTSRNNTLFLLNPSPQVSTTIDLVHLTGFFQILHGDDAILTLLPD